MKFMPAILTIEELARVDPSVSVLVDVQVRLNSLLFLTATPEHFSRYSLEKVG